MNTSPFTSTSKIIFFFLGIVIVSAAVWYNQSVGAQGLASSNLVTTKNTNANAKNDQALLNQLKKVKIDATFFQSNLFGSLEDFGVPVKLENYARSNPFAPIGVE